jgi:hypothetical protein
MSGPLFHSSQPFFRVQLLLCLLSKLNTSVEPCDRCSVVWKSVSDTTSVDPCELRNSNDLGLSGRFGGSAGFVDDAADDSRTRLLIFLLVPSAD